SWPDFIAWPSTSTLPERTSAWTRLREWSVSLAVRKWSRRGRPPSPTVQENSVGFRLFFLIFALSLFNLIPLSPSGRACRSYPALLRAQFPKNSRRGQSGERAPLAGGERQK